MKKTLTRVWKDITRGKHIIDYVLILAAIVLPVLNLVGLLTSDRLVLAMLPILGLLIAKAVAQTWEKGNDIRIHENWTGEVYEAFTKAKKSIVVLTSWVVDATTIADKIKKASGKTNRKLTVEIYMLDPDKPFGAQRYWEVYRSIKPYSTDCEIQYRSNFAQSVMHFRNRLGNVSNVDLKIYKYDTLPTAKVFIVDDEKFFFGWLQAKAASTENVCIELSARSRDEDVLYTIDRLKDHIEGLEKSRVLLPPSSQTDEVLLIDDKQVQSIDQEKKGLAGAEV